MTAQDRLDGLASALVRWYRRHSRDLPWRATTDPYAIWVSEVMLQQTQVATVRGRFGPFLEQFPTVRALAEAPMDAVLKAWEGMGYYGRARNMHRAAGRIVAEFAGKLPDSVEELRKLPGIGPYTAGAVASIAFGRDEPVLDGNVTRVLCRVHRICRNPKEARVRDRLWYLCRQLVPAGQASLFNQALMDLGATVCVRRDPRCRSCPLEEWCEARAHGEENELPIRGARRKVPHYDVAVGIVWRGGKILIDRRKPEGLLGGMWEFPGGKRKGKETLKACAAREVLEEVGVDVMVNRRLVTVKHAYTHFRLTLRAYECWWLSGRARALQCSACRWVRLEELDLYAFAAASHKVIAVLRKGRG